MGNRVRKLNKGDVIFKEGDAPESMFIIRSGRVAITKAKGQSNITLAELKNGDMIGEMGFFEKKPRSAGAKVLTPGTEVIELPFVALEKQYESLPVWLKAVMKTVTNHLRSANAKIRLLEKSKEEEKELFSSHLITQLTSVLGFVAAHYGTTVDSGEGRVQVPAGTLRTYTIQIFRLPTSKMQTLIETLAARGVMTIEPLGEGKQRLIVEDVGFLFRFVEFFNNQFFSDEAKKFNLSEKQLQGVQALVEFSKDTPRNGRGYKNVDVDYCINQALTVHRQKVEKPMIQKLSESGLLGEYTSDGKKDFVEIDVDYLTEISRYWELYFDLKAHKSR